MSIWRYFRENLIVLDFQAEQEPEPEDSTSEKWKERNKERILSALVDILEKSDLTGNRCKLLNDFINRERKATTAIGQGIAVPHVRTMQAKEFVLAFARNLDGYYFNALDEEPVKMFFAMAAPPYDDNLYLRVFKELSMNLQHDYFRQKLLEIEKPYDVIRAFRNME